MASEDLTTDQTPAAKKRFRWEILVVIAAILGVIAMEAVPTAAFIIYQHDRNQAVERIYACRAKRGLATADRSLIKWELEAKGAKIWRQTAAQLEAGC